jgi:hypothetical protein
LYRAEKYPRPLKEGTYIREEWDWDMETLQKLLPEHDVTNFSEAELKYWQNMLEKNEVFRDKMELWDEDVDAIISKFPAYHKYNLKPILQENMNKFSPARKTKSILEFRDKIKTRFPIQDLTLSQIAT